MKLLTLLLVGLSAVALCHAGTVMNPERIAQNEDCQMGCENGVCIADHGSFKCICTNNWFGSNCSQHICDKEGASLCQNGGTCLVNPNNISDFLCSCPLGYAGRNCQYLTHGSACLDSPCGDNGTCYNHAAGGYECVCRPGSYGVNCNIPSNQLCTGSDVQNCYGNGICSIINKAHGPEAHCTCYPEFDDSSRCRWRAVYDVCFSERPCENGGVCNYVFGGDYQCECPFNKTGRNCTEDFDVCDPNPCANGGTCSPAFGGHFHQCSCLPNYDGYNCEFVVDPCSEDSGVCLGGQTCLITSPPETNGWYNISTVQTECLNCTYELPDHCSSAPCGIHGDCTSTPYGYTCQCHAGFDGEHCSVPDNCADNPCLSAHSTDCVNLPEQNSFMCLCLEGWGGQLCSLDIDECSSGVANCNGGICVNTQGGYLCGDCPLNRTGPRCDILLTCDNMPCSNGGTCSESGGVFNCSCPAGYTGPTCESEICALKDHCANVAGNGVCDYDCYTASCNYDGGDNCTLNPNSTSPWSNCKSAVFCAQAFGDGNCDVQCNSAKCFYDGGDCLPTCSNQDNCVKMINDGRCSPECNTQECPFDYVECNDSPEYLNNELVLILVTNEAKPFSGSFRDEFLYQLGRLTNTLPSVAESKLISPEEATRLAKIHPINLRIINAQSNSSLIYLVRLRLDVRLCKSGCPTTTDDVVNTIEAHFESGNSMIGNFTIASAYAQPPSPPDTTGGLSSTVIGVVCAVVVLVVLVVLVAGILLGKRKIHAKIWRPHSPASESDNASNSHGNDSRRRSSQAGGAVTGTEPSSLQHSDSDNFMEKGAKKAKMMPANGDSKVEYEQIDGRYEVAHDSRRWNHAHYEAVRNPRRVRELLVGYKKLHGETLDVNAAGPGGFTPLMLVVMKRHSSHESIASAEHTYAPFYAPYHDRAALVNGAAAGRPISNGSIISRDGCYYSPHGFLPPIESSLSTLLKANVNLNATNDFGQTALQLAAACSRADYVEQLLEAGANPNVTDNWGQSALQVAIGACAEGSFMILINHPKTDLNQKSDGGITPLMAAVKVVNQYMLKMLIKKNADIAATDNDGRTALHWAAMVDNLDALKLLIRHGPETIKDAQDNKGQTALFLACREGSYGCVKHLIDCFANATLLDNLDQSPVQIAMQKRHDDIVALLQTQGPISYPPRVNLPYRPPGSHLDQEQMFQQYQGTGRPLIKPFKSKARQDHRNLADPTVHVSYMSDLQRQQQSHEMAYFGSMAPSHDPMNPPQQTFGDLAQMPISTDPSSIPMSALGQSSYSSGAAAAVASVSSVTSTVHNQAAGSPPTCMGSSVVNTHPVMANYLMSNSSDQSHLLQQSTTPPSSSQYASPPSAGYGNPSPGYESDFIGGQEIPSSSSSAGVTMSQSLSPQSYSRLPSTSSAVSSAGQPLPPYSRYSGYSRLEQHNPPPPVSAYAGSTRPLQHLPFVSETSMSTQLPHSSAGGGLVSSDQTYQHTSPPHMGSVSSGSPSSAYPSPLQPSNELHTNYIHSNGYAYSTSSRTSPPSLTPSPESREDQLVNAHGTFSVENHAQEFPQHHTHITAGMTIV